MNLRPTVFAIGMAVAVAGAVRAEAPEFSPIPKLRPGTEVSQRTVAPGDADRAVRVALGSSAPGLRVSPKPVPRPRIAYRAAPPAAGPAPAAPAVETDGPERVVLASGAAAARTPPPVPPKRPKGLLAAIFRAPDKPVTYPRSGSVCGDPAIRGQSIPPIPARLRGCGLDDGVRVTAIDGVLLSQPAKIDCTTARALRRWVGGTVKPAVGDLGGGVVALKVAAHYSCRTRNNQPGGQISEHGRGRAIDISAIVLKNGVSMTVLQGWNDRVQGPILRKVHARACGTFGTVLGPGADRFHREHLQLDTARHRGGAYCR